MKRRNQIKNIAYGILGSFLSRNNDIDGYWALGVFYKIAFEQGSQSFELNILSKESHPCYKYSHHVASFYQNYLYSQIKKQKLSSLTIIDARVVLEFNVEQNKNHINKKWTWGEPFTCEVKLTDENNAVNISNGSGWCGMHDTTIERRSIRRINS